MCQKVIIVTGACLLLALAARAELPATITTRDGQTYHGVSLIRAEPDGYLVNYEPLKNGMGIAKIKFSRLSEDMQKEAGYNPEKAREFEAGVAKANESQAQDSISWDAAARAERQARQAREDQLDLQRMAIQTQLNQALAAQEQTAAEPSSWSSLGGGYGVYAVPRFANRHVKTGFQPAPGHIPFASPVPARPPQR